MEMKFDLTQSEAVALLVALRNAYLVYLESGDKGGYWQDRAKEVDEVYLRLASQYREQLEQKR